MSTPEKITTLRRDRDALLNEAAELRQRATKMEAEGHRKNSVARLRDQARDKEQLAVQKQADITKLAQPSLF